MARLDPAEGFEVLKGRVKEAIAESFPHEGSKNVLELESIDIPDKLSVSDVTDQKSAKMNDRTWGVPVHATLILKDKKTDKILDRSKIKIATLPKITNRYSYIVDGSEYQVDNQWRLKPGVYTKVQQNGELDSFFNIKGQPLHIGFDPKERSFVFKHGGAQPPLYPIMRALGHSDSDLEKAWGKDILNANMVDSRGKVLNIDKHAINFANRMDPEAEVDSFEKASEVIKQKLEESKLHPDVTSRTLGKPIDRITPDAVLRSSQRLLGIARGTEKPDVRDSLMYKEFLSTEDFIGERIRQTAPVIKRRIGNNIDRRDRIRDIVGMDVFQRPIKEFFSKVSLASTPEQTNPLKMISGQLRTTIAGEGGVMDANRITEDAKLVDPSHFGVLDPLHTPECHSADTEVFTSRGWVSWPDVSDDEIFACRVEGRLEFHRADRVIRKRYKGQLFGAETEYLSYRVTPNHRMWCHTRDQRSPALYQWHFETAEEIFEKTRNLITIHEPYIGSGGEQFQLPYAEGNHTTKNVSDLDINVWAAFLGWYLSEGSYTYDVDASCYRVSISQVREANPDSCKEIEWILSKLPFKWCYTGHAYVIGVKQLAHYMKRFGFCESKFIPEYMFEASVSAREELLGALLMGDGRLNYRRQNGDLFHDRDTYTTTSEQLADDVERLIISLGYAATHRFYRDQREDRYLDVHEVRILRRKERQVRAGIDHVREDYDGMVYCATVPGGLLYTRRNSKTPIWTGNSVKTGVNLQLSLGARKVGTRIEIPLISVKTGKVVYLDPGKINDSIVALPDSVKRVGDKFVPKDGTTVLVSAVGNELKHVPIKDVEYIVPRSSQIFSIATNMVPFISSDSPNRATMAGRHMEQAIPLRDPEPPLVQSVLGKKSFDELVGSYASHSSPVTGKITQVGKDAIHVLGEDNKSHAVSIYNYYPTNDKKGMIHSNSLVKAGDKVTKGQVIADTNFSVSGDEEVLVREFDVVRRVKLCDLVFSENQEVLALSGADLRYEWKHLEELFKHKTSDPLMRITTRCGRSFKVTASHSCLTVNDKGDIVEVRPVDMTAGKTVIPVMGSVPVGGDCWDIAPYGPKSRHQKNATREIHSELRLDRELGFLLGMYLSEGDIPHTKYVRIAVTNDTLRKVVISAADHCGFPVTEQINTVTIGCAQLSRAVKAEFGHLAAGKVVPGWVFAAPRDFVEGMIDGIWSGDGTLYLENESVCSSFQSDSEDLTRSTQSLLSELGVISSFSEFVWRAPGFVDPNERHFRLWVAGASIGMLPQLSHPEKERLRQSWMPPAHDKIAVAPLPRDLCKVKALNVKMWKGFGGLTFVRRNASGRLCDLINGEVLWDLVEHIEEIDPEPLVYDLVVRDHATFVLLSGITVHNTKNGIYSPGKNLEVAYMPWRGYNFEDGVVISESASQKLTSEHLIKHGLSTKESKLVSPKKYQAYYQDRLNKEQAAKLDEDGVIKPGMKVKPGDTLITALQEHQITTEEQKLKLLHKSLVRPYKDKAVTWDEDIEGEVVEVNKRGSRVDVHIKTSESMDVGDKIVGRHGNKGIVTLILPDHEMPKTKDGRSIEVIMNPIGTPGRMNIGQVLETAAAKIARKTGEPFKVTNFEIENNLEHVEAELKKHGLTDKETIVDPKTGKEIPGIQVGPQYILKMEHQVGKKMAARSRDSYDRNLVPKGGGPHGAQALGSLGIYSMLAHGAKANLREMSTYKSDKSQGGDNDELWSALQAGEMLPPPRTTFAYKKFDSYLKAIGVNTEKDGNSLNLIPLTDKHVLEMSNGELKDAGRVIKMRTLQPEKGGLFDPKITGGSDGTNWSHITLSASMPNPLFEKAVMSVANIRGPQFDKIINGSAGVLNGVIVEETGVKGATYGPSAIGHLLAKVDVKKDLAIEEGRIQGLKGQLQNESRRKVRYLRALDKLGMKPTEAYMMNHVPILPPNMRPIAMLDDGSLQTDDLNELYKQLAIVNNKHAEFPVGTPQSLKAPLQADIYDHLKALTGLGGTLNRKHPGILDVLSGRDGPKCFDGETEVLCRDGWKRFDEYIDEEEIAAVEINSGAIKWERPSDLTITEYRGRMVHLTSRYIDLLVTPNHNLVAQKRVKIDGEKLYEPNMRLVPVQDVLADTSRFRMKTSAHTMSYLPESLEFGGEKVVDLESFAEFVGWWIAEGWIGKPTKDGPGQVYLGQVKTEGVALIDRCISSIGLQYSRSIYKKKVRGQIKNMVYWSIINCDLSRWLIENCGRRQEDRKISDNILSWSEVLLKRVLDGYMIGDGSRPLCAENGKTWYRRSKLAGRFSTISPHLVSDIQRLAIQIGLGVLNRTPVLAHNKINYCASVIGFEDTTIDSHVRIVLRSYNSLVYGPTVSTGALLVRRNGIVAVSGNSSFVQDVLIKRKQDLTMRSTIVPEPSLSLDEAEIPRKAAKEMYKPFIVRELRRTTGATPLAAKKMIDEDDPLAHRALDRVVAERPILLKRDPVLHKYGIQAFKPKLVDGKAIKIHPLVCSGFNADFDGDAMSAYVPITAEAVKEAEQMFPSRNLFSPATGSVMYTPGHEAQVGLFMMADAGKHTNLHFKDNVGVEQAVKANTVHQNDVIHVNGVRTTYSRIQLNNLLPSELQGGKLLTDLNFRFTKKEQEKLFNDMAAKDRASYPAAINKMKDLGNEAATMGSFSFGLGDFKVHKDIRDPVLKLAETKAAKLDLSKKDQLNKFIDIYEGAMKDIDVKLKQRIEDPKYHNNLIKLEIAAGIKGKGLRQLTVAPVLFVDGKGEVVTSPVKKSYSEGLSSGDYWTATSGGRKGAIQKVQSVSEPGYLTKQMANSTMDMLVADHDCGTTRGISLSIDEPDVIGRYTVADLKLHRDTIPAGTLLTPEIMNRVKNAKIDKVVVRSPMRCVHGKGICAVCMGLSENGRLNDLGTNVGILATQSIGERGTQLAMKSYHSGGVFEGREAATKSIAAGALDRAVNILNLPQKIRGSSILSTTMGRVNKIEKDPAGGVQININDKQHYVPADRLLLDKIRVGAQVKKGDPITDGPVNPHELLPLTNMSKVQGHLAGELHSIYGQYGIKRRHSELLVKALSNVTKVDNPGDHPDLLPGDFTSTTQVYEWNKQNPKAKPVMHTPVLRGVKTIPLDIQEDWMARLNHEHLKSTLVEAAQQGWQSNLHGMNPIPALMHGAEFGKGTKKEPWAY